MAIIRVDKDGWLILSRCEVPGFKEILTCDGDICVGKLLGSDDIKDAKVIANFLESKVTSTNTQRDEIIRDICMAEGCNNEANVCNRRGRFCVEHG